MKRYLPLFFCLLLTFDSEPLIAQNIFKAATTLTVKGLLSAKKKRKPDNAQNDTATAGNSNSELKKLLCQNWRLFGVASQIFRGNIDRFPYKTTPILVQFNEDGTVTDSRTPGVVGKWSLRKDQGQTLVDFSNFKAFEGNYLTPSISKLTSDTLIFPGLYFVRVNSASDILMSSPSYVQPERWKPNWNEISDTTGKVPKGTITYYTDNQQITALKLYFTPDTSAYASFQRAGNIAQLRDSKGQFFASFSFRSGYVVEFYEFYENPFDVSAFLKTAPKFNYTYTEEPKQIFGFKCKKVIATDTKSHESFDVWVTNDISVPSTAMPLFYADIKGFPIQYTVVNDGIKTLQTIRSVTDERVPNRIFGIQHTFQKLTFKEDKKDPKNSAFIGTVYQYFH